MDSRVVGELEYAELVLDGVLSGRVIKIYEESDSIAGMLCLDKDRVKWVSGDSIAADTVAGMQFIGRAFKAVWRLIVRAVMAVVSGLKRLWEWLTGGKGSTNPDTPGATYQDTPTPVGGKIGKQMAREDKAVVETALIVAELEEKGVDIEKAVSEVTPEMLEAAHRENNTRDEARISKIEKDAEDAEEFNKRERERLDGITSRFNATAKQEAANKKEAERIAAADKEVRERAAARDDARINVLRKQRSGFTRIKITNAIRAAYAEEVGKIENNAILTSGGIDKDKMRRAVYKAASGSQNISRIDLADLRFNIKEVATNGPSTERTKRDVGDAYKRLIAKVVLRTTENVYEIFNMPEGYASALIDGMVDGVDEDELGGALVSPDTGGGRVFTLTMGRTGKHTPKFTLAVTSPSTPPTLEHLDIPGFSAVSEEMQEYHEHVSKTSKAFEPAQKQILAKIKKALRVLDEEASAYKDHPDVENIHSVIESIGNEYANVTKALKFVTHILNGYQDAYTSRATLAREIVGLVINSPSREK